MPYAREGVEARARRARRAPATPAESLWEALDDPASRSGPASGRPASTSSSSRRSSLRRSGPEAWPRSPPTCARRPTIPTRRSAATPRTAAAAVEYVAAAEPAARRLRRQADRLQGRRPAARRLAARRSRANPDARLLMVGFGEYRERARALWSALAAGDLAARGGDRRRGRAWRAGASPLEDASEPSSPTPRRLRRARRAAAAGSVCLRRPARARRGRRTGRPRRDALVMPSTFPEAFGMVAAEAAAAGALPVCAGHSGHARGRARARRGPAPDGLRTSSPSTSATARWRRSPTV